MAFAISPLFTLLVLVAVSVNANNLLDCNDKVNGRSCEDLDSPEDLSFIKPNTGVPNSKPNSPIIELKPSALPPYVQRPLDKVPPQTNPTILPPEFKPSVDVSLSLNPPNTVLVDPPMSALPPIDVSKPTSRPELGVPIVHKPHESKPVIGTLCSTTGGPTETFPPTIVAPLNPYLAVCGRKNNCYQWFDDEWQLAIDGYQPCTQRDKLRAARYCCT